MSRRRETDALDGDDISIAGGAGPQHRLHEPQVRLHVFRRHGDPVGRFSPGQGRKEDELIRQVAVHRAARGKILPEGRHDELGDRLRAPSRFASLIGPEDAACCRLGSKEKNRPFLQGGGVLKDFDLRGGVLSPAAPGSVRPSAR